MISPTSISYPTLAVVQDAGVDDEASINAVYAHAHVLSPLVRLREGLRRRMEVEGALPSAGDILKDDALVALADESFMTLAQVLGDISEASFIDRALTTSLTRAWAWCLDNADPARLRASLVLEAAA